MGKNIIKVNNINVNKNKLEYIFSVEGEIERFFNKQEKLYVEYNENVEDVPKGVLIIPLISNICQIAWFFNSEIQLEEIDEKFYKSLDDVKEAFYKMYPKAKRGGAIKAKKIEKYSYKDSGKSLSFFTGGVDSLATVITNMDKKPDLVTVWGADIKLKDKNGWDNVKNKVSNFAKDKGLNNVFIKSNFREFINEKELDHAFNSSTETTDGWWFSIQHGIGLIGMVAPYTYIKQIKNIYIPASLNLKSESYKIASHPSIDNKMKFASVKVIHEGFENTRQDKIGIICDYVKNTKGNLNIRVCWKSDGGDNCSVCEKCSRTIMGIIAEKMNPNEFGFNVDNEAIKEIKNNWKYNWSVNGPNTMHWNNIRERYIENKEFWQGTELEWILKINFFKESEFKRTLGGRVRNKLYKVIKKVT